MRVETLVGGLERADLCGVIEPVRQNVRRGAQGQVEVEARDFRGGFVEVADDGGDGFSAESL